MEQFKGEPLIKIPSIYKRIFLNLRMIALNNCLPRHGVENTLETVKKNPLISTDREKQIFPSEINEFLSKMSSSQVKGKIRIT